MTTTELLKSSRARDIAALPHYLSTTEAAQALNRKPCTLRRWACMGGPIDPLRLHGRLAWPLDQIRTLLGAESPSID